MVDTSWTFTVLFIAIVGVLIVFAAIWLTSQRSRPHR
jgi:HAMP domain-containing protein